MSALSIGQLAQQAGVAIATVRYGERNAFLARAGRLASGYRRHGDTVLKRLRLIRRAKALGCSLDDVRTLLSLSEEPDLAEVKRAAQRKLSDIERRIGEPEPTRTGLDTFIAACTGPGRSQTCPILNALTQAESA